MSDKVPGRVSVRSNDPTLHIMILHCNCSTSGEHTGVATHCFQIDGNWQDESGSASELKCAWVDGEQPGKGPNRPIERSRAQPVLVPPPRRDGSQEYTRLNLITNIWFGNDNRNDCFESSLDVAIVHGQQWFREDVKVIRCVFLRGRNQCNFTQFRAMWRQLG